MPRNRSLKIIWSHMYVPVPFTSNITSTSVILEPPEKQLFYKKLKIVERIKRVNKAKE